MAVPTTERTRFSERVRKQSALHVPLRLPFRGRPVAVTWRSLEVAGQGPSPKHSCMLKLVHLFDVPAAATVADRTPISKGA